MGELVLVRHGETSWSASGRHTGRTDVPLTSAGEEQARRLGDRLGRRRFRLVLTSPLLRAAETARISGFGEAERDDDLAEWDYGGYEGRTTPEISSELGTRWSLWSDGVVPGATPGESIAQVAARADRVLSRVRPVLSDGDVALFAHGHLLRVLAARWVGLAPAYGAVLALSAGSVSVLGFEHGRPVVRSWNLGDRPGERA